MQSTRVIQLHSGVESTITRLSNRHQSILTDRNLLASGDAINAVLTDCTVGIRGVDGPIDDKAVRSLLSIDRKKLISEIRNLSLRDPNHFLLSYKTEDGRTREAEIDLSTEQYKIRPMKLPYYEGVLLTADYTGEPVSYDKIEWRETTYESYSDIRRQFCIGVGFEKDPDPNSLQNVKYDLLDGNGEIRLAKMPKKVLKAKNILAQLDVRNIRYTIEKDGKQIESPLTTNLLSYQGCEDLRGAAMAAEGRYDTIVEFEDEETGEHQAINLLAQPAFFFPRGV